MQVIEGTISAKATSDEAIVRGDDTADSGTNHEEEDDDEKKINELENDEEAPNEEIAFTLGPEGFK